MPSANDYPLLDLQTVRPSTSEPCTDEPNTRALAFPSSARSGPTPIRSSLSDQLRKYDEKMVELQEELQQMAVERAALQTEYGDSRSLLAPVRRLPFEIMGEILARIRPPVEQESLREILTINASQIILS
ncbi:hypothetical protein C8R44DRAFT_981998 [Mycena epipterygia]|nr:hypothetical protein C8R44DRAFT_981998 [Mycena epipterygia]